MQHVAAVSEPKTNLDESHCCKDTPPLLVCVSLREKAKVVPGKVGPMTLIHGTYSLKKRAKFILVS